MSDLRKRMNRLEQAHQPIDDYRGLSWVLTEPEWQALTAEDRARYARAPYLPLIICGLDPA